jgi:N-acetylmuramoyl-L-alanine amidase
MLRATVVIDPGHGGTAEAGGSSANNAISFSGVQEKTMTLQMGLLVRDALLALNSAETNLKVVMTRATDVNLGLRERALVAKSNQAQRFLSIHFNGFDKNARGVETLIRPIADGNVNHAEDMVFAGRIQKAVLETIKGFDSGAKDRGVKDQKLGVLRDELLGNTAASHPCRACLLEIEFIDVEQVDKLLNTNPNAATVRSAIAKAIAAAILEDLKNG